MGISHLHFLFGEMSFQILSLFLIRGNYEIGTGNKKLWEKKASLVVKNPPANTGERGSTPDPGRSHMP